MQYARTRTTARYSIANVLKHAQQQTGEHLQFTISHAVMQAHILNQRQNTNENTHRKKQQ